MNKQELLLVVGMAMTVAIAGCSGPRQAARVRDMSEKTVAQIQGQMARALQAKLAKSGAAASIGECAAQFRELTRAAGARLRADEKNGLREIGFRRTSLKLRNPANKPSAFESAVLKKWSKREAGGKRARSVLRREENGWQAIVPVRISAPVCLACHGDPGRMDGAVREALTANFPRDAALGYKLNDLRGALTVKLKY